MVTGGGKRKKKTYKKKKTKGKSVTKKKATKKKTTERKITKKNGQKKKKATRKKKTTYFPKCIKKYNMAAIHTKAVAIFIGQLINEVEDKIQYVKCRPSQSFDSNTPINFTIPGNSSQFLYVNLICLYNVT